MVVLPLLLLGGIEVVLRLIGYGYPTNVFKKIQIDGQPYFVENDAFAFRFFPVQMARFPGPIRMAAKKSADTYRIFVLGESAAMGDPEPAYAASRYLKVLLSRRYPKAHFEIINLGITAIDSHVILPIARDCARHQGDLWIIYMGNNEMVGPFGAATVFGAKAPPLAMIRFDLAIQKTRLGQLLVNLGRKLKGVNANNPSWGGMEMFIGNQLMPDDSRKEVVYQNFKRNLHDIVRVGLDSGAKILLNTVAVNLKDCAPFASLINTNLPAGDRAQYEQFFSEGTQFENQGDYTEAVQEFTLAAKLDPKVAELQFRWGKSLLQLTNYNAARVHLQLACDDDALPFRADSRINAIIRNERKINPDDDLVLFDAASMLAAETPDDICGRETFFEHVHFEFEGNYRLGRAWAEQVAAMMPADITHAAAGDWATQEACNQQLGLSDWNRTFVIQHMIERLQQPPLSSQLDNAERMNQLTVRLNQLHARMNAATEGKTSTNFLKALEQSPDDYYLHENFALFLQSVGDLRGAIAEWRHVHNLIPQDCIADFQLGRLLGAKSQWVEAESLLREAVVIRPSLTQGWIELGNVLASQGKFEPALISYSRAHRQQPQDPRTIFRIGEVLAKLNRHSEAIENYRAAIELDPQNWEIHFELGGELDLENQLPEACEQFAAAARLDPDNSRTHFNYGVLLAKLGRLDEAQHEFEETIRLEPTYQKARDYLAALQVMNRQRLSPVEQK